MHKKKISLNLWRFSRQKERMHQFAYARFLQLCYKAVALIISASGYRVLNLCRMPVRFRGTG